jgi:hypothetical protein
MRFTFICILLLVHWGIRAQGFQTRHFVPGALNNTAKAIFETTPNNYIAAGIIVE